jgi:hypothetical protein
MQDDEYPTYLKKKSYDELISISYSIDKEVAAKRYAMVLAEIAERDKRGEGEINIPEPRLKIQKPAVVSRATGLLIFDLAIGFITLFWLWFHVTEGQSTGVGTTTLLFMAFLIYNIGGGHNWARITFLASFILGFLVSILILPRLFSDSPVQGGIFIVHVVLQTIALIMLFSRSARPWFRPSTNPPTTPDDTNNNA